MTNSHIIEWAINKYDLEREEIIDIENQRENKEKSIKIMILATDREDAIKFIQEYEREFTLYSIDEGKGFESMWIQKLIKGEYVTIDIICAPSLDNSEDLVEKRMDEVDGWVLIYNTKDLNSFELIKGFVKDHKEIFEEITYWTLYGIVNSDDNINIQSKRIKFMEENWKKFYEFYEIDLDCVRMIFNDFWNSVINKNAWQKVNTLVLIKKLYYHLPLQI